MKDGASITPRPHSARRLERRSAHRCRDLVIRSGLLLAVLALLGACGSPSTSDSGSDSSSRSGTVSDASDDTTPEDKPPQTGELLIASPPEGWVETSSLNQGTLRIAEYADPQTLTPDQVDSVRFESQAGTPLPDPINLVLGFREELRSNCTGFRDFPIFSGYENGYPTSVRLMLCRSQGDPARGLVRMVKAIQGKELFYIVTRSRSSAPFAPESEPMSVEDMAIWSAWVGGIKVCDTRSDEHPCPAQEKAD